MVAALAMGGGAAGVFAYVAISQRQDEAIAKFEATKAYRQPSSEQNRARERAAAIGGMLGELKNKTTREKIEGAFDGAVQTHNIGFPQPKRTLTVKMDASDPNAGPDPTIGVG
jgi:hypothetical protein